MKKENRKMAMERRAKEREALEQKKKRNKILSIAIPAAVAVILVIAIAADSISRNSSSSSTTTTDTSSSETEAESVLSTDSSLTVADGDTVNIDYVGTIDGVEFSGGNTNGAGADLVIGSGSYIDDFEDQLIGAHPGDEVDVTVTFPENYGNEDLNGKEAVFAVTVNGIYQ